ncbi:MAG: glycosyl transferase group 1, partial [Pseudonocardiales bacterium]|nr:glycosyl transferase group 1 [Pseudonocardiales bacterium]
VRASLGADAGDVLLVAITRLDPEKRIEDLFEALGPMMTEPGWHLAIVGVTSSYPDYAEQMQALAETRLGGRVTFAGRREDVPAILNAADVLVHTGVVEGMPLGIIEAQACGRPVVAYRVAGVPEAVIEGTTGLLAAPGDTAELGRHIARLICDTGRRDEMGRAARVHARAHHSIDTQADGHADVLARVTTGRTSTSVHPASRPPRVLLANHWHDDNRGDSAITQGILSVLRATAPTSTVTVATLAEPGDLSNGGTRHLERFWPGLRVESSPIATELRGRMGKRSRPRIVVDAALWAARLSPDLFNVLTGKGRSAWSALMAEQDLVILVGGSNIFDDHGVPAVLSLPRLVEVLSPAQAGVRTGVPVVLLGHTLGPFARPLGRRIAGRLLAGVTRVVVRESTSVPVARRIGAVVVEEAPDMAFAITPEHSPKVTRLLSELPVAASRLLVMSARTHPTLGADADARLVGVFAEAARRLVADGILDGVAVVAHTIGPTPVEDDRPISRALVDALAALPVVLVDEDISPAELSAFYGSVGAVVAVRLHAAILALNGGTPTFAVSYLTAKTQGVMTQVGLPDAVADFATVTADAVVAGVTTQLAVPGLRATLEGRAVGRRQELFGRGAVWFAALNPAGPIRAISSEMVEVSS